MAPSKALERSTGVASESDVIKVELHARDHQLLKELPVEEISDRLCCPDELFWVDVTSPTPADLSLLAEEFGFHPLAMEDTAKRHQRPKVDFYDEFLFIVFYALESSDGHPQTVEMNLFAGKNFLVTVHSEDVPAIGETAERWRQQIPKLGHRGIGLLIYSLLDAIVDDYFPVIDALTERIEDLEQAVFERFDNDAQAAIFGLKKDLLAVRRVLGPERDVMNVLVRRDSPVFGAETIVYFQDVYDHILRVTDAVDTYRDLLSSALDAYLSVTSNRLNQVMRTLTASSIILMSMTLVASVYGMNFVHMPELSWQLGYAWALGLMLSIGFVILGVFRRIDWL